MSLSSLSLPSTLIGDDIDVRTVRSIGGAGLVLTLGSEQHTRAQTA